jgi:hypothetical protein
VVVNDVDARTAACEMGNFNSYKLAEDVQMIADLKRLTVEREQVMGSELLMAIFDQRFVSGVRLKGATGDMPGAQIRSRWLFTAHDGETPGWQRPTSWRKVKVAARVLGPGGLILFATGGREFATFLYNRRDDTARVLEVQPNGHLEATNLDEYARAHSFPAAIAAIDRCGEVHA